MTTRPWEPPNAAGWRALGATMHVPDGALLASMVEWQPCFRIIASEYAGENLFDRLTGTADDSWGSADVDALRDIADLTNPSTEHSAEHTARVRPEDRVYGPGSGLIMAAFAFPGRPSRFSDGTSGVYYAARSRETAIAETCYHEARMLRGSGPCVTEKTVIEAALVADLVDIRGTHPAPAGVYDPINYAVGQQFGALIRQLDGDGIVYDAVRIPRGECVAVFRPRGLSNARPVAALRYHWDGSAVARVT